MSTALGDNALYECDEVHQLCDRGGICRHILQRQPRFSAALYNGHTAALFVFDASCMEDSLNKAAWCIAELKQTVGPNKFRLMPKLLVCSLPFEVHTWQLTNVTSNSHFDFDGMHAAGCLANNCFWLISWTWELLLRKSFTICVATLSHFLVPTPRS